MFVKREDGGDLFVDLDGPSLLSGIFEASDGATGSSIHVPYIPASSANACVEPTR